MASIWPKCGDVAGHGHGVAAVVPHGGDDAGDCTVSSRPCATTAAPRRANSFAMASPMPLELPVTIATRPSNILVSLLVILGSLSWLVIALCTRYGEVEQPARCGRWARCAPWAVEHAPTGSGEFFCCLSALAPQMSIERHRARCGAVRTLWSGTVEGDWMSLGKRRHVRPP